MFVISKKFGDYSSNKVAFLEAVYELGFQFNENEDFDGEKFIEMFGAQAIVRRTGHGLSISDEMKEVIKGNTFSRIALMLTAEGVLEVTEFNACLQDTKECVSYAVDDDVDYLDCMTTDEIRQQCPKVYVPGDQFEIVDGSGEYYKINSPFDVSEVIIYEEYYCCPI